MVEAVSTVVRVEQAIEELVVEVGAASTAVVVDLPLPRSWGWSPKSYHSSQEVEDCQHKESLLTLASLLPPLAVEVVAAVEWVPMETQLVHWVESWTWEHPLPALAHPARDSHLEPDPAEQKGLRGDPQEPASCSPLQLRP